MFRPPVRRPLVSVLPLVILGIAQVTTPRPETGFSAVEESIGAMVLALVVGGGLILLAPDYTDRATRRILEEPIDTLLYGLGIGLLVLVAMAVLIVTVVGILLAIPMAVIVIVFSEFGYLAAGRALTDNWALVLLVAVGASAVVAAVPILGGLLGLLLGSFGLGGAYLEARSDTRTRSDRSGGTEPTSADGSPPR